MTTAQESESEVVDFKPPMLDLDAMLEDLHNGFQDPPEQEGAKPEHDEEFGRSEPYRGVSGTPEGSDAASGGVGGSGTGEPEAISEGVGDLLPPGYVRVGEEVLPEAEVRGFLDLNRKLKAEPDTATRVREALFPSQKPPEQAVDPDALPAWIDPDDQQSVFLFRQNQRIEREVEELRRNEAARAQQQVLSQQEARKVEVLDAFRSSMKEFRDEHPTFGPEDLKVITDRAASMGLLEAPEKVGGTLRAGIVTALDTAMWSMPEYREKVTSGATVPSKEQKSATRKQKSSALSSSTGSVVRTQSQEPTPTTRKEVVAGALDFLRSGAVTD
jgi:hypothetical protein